MYLQHLHLVLSPDQVESGDETSLWNSYEPVHGERAVPPLFTLATVIGAHVQPHPQLMVIAIGYFTVFISARVKLVQTVCVKPLHLSGFVYTSNRSCSGLSLGK